MKTLKRSRPDCATRGKKPTDDFTRQHDRAVRELAALYCEMAQVMAAEITQKANNNRPATT